MATTQKEAAEPLSAAPAPPAPAGLPLPLSDAVVNLKAAGTLASNAQTREKALKILQYSAKLLAYLLAKSAREATTWSKHLEALSKNLSTARRFFKLFRWVKHFEDIADARSEKKPWFQKLLLLDVVANLAADLSEDFTSLEKVGILRKGTLPKRTEYYANWCQLVLACVEICVAYVKASRAREKSGPNASISVQRKSVMANLELSKFAADLLKAFWDCELSFASELLFCISGLWAALVSTHKYALKVLK